MNLTQALEFATASAAQAFDQRFDYDDSAVSFLGNLTDTLNSEATCLTNQEYDHVVKLYRAEIVRLFA